MKIELHSMKWIEICKSICDSGLKIRDLKTNKPIFSFSFFGKKKQLIKREKEDGYKTIKKNTKTKHKKERGNSPLNHKENRSPFPFYVMSGRVTKLSKHVLSHLECWECNQNLQKRKKRQRL